MKTKIQIMGDDEIKPKIKNPIKFGELLSEKGEWFNHGRPDDLNFITLICKNYFTDGYTDLILIHKNKNPSLNSEDAVLYRGKWNDGTL